MSLILDKFKSAIIVLEESYKESELVLQSDVSSVLKNTLKSGVIQNFEVCYELAWKFMKRWLENNESAETINALSRKDLYRYAHSKKMIVDIQQWFIFHNLRNESSHTYNESVVLDIYGAIPLFIQEVQILYHFLDTHND